jgi:CDP-glycerol glycerophosphotransferase (TagB/SpsB family)
MLVYPDTICVPDIKAYTLVMGFQPAVDVIIASNFYHDYLKGWKAPVSRNIFFTKNSIPQNNKLIVFAPEPLSNVGGVEEYGLDEITVFKDLLKAASSLNSDDISIVFKSHPNQKINLFENLNLSDSLHVMSGDNLHLNTLLYHADVVVGIFSNILIEATILETKVIRCLIGLKKEDPFSHFQIGEVAISELELANLLKKMLD